MEGLHTEGSIQEGLHTEGSIQDMASKNKSEQSRKRGEKKMIHSSTESRRWEGMLESIRKSVWGDEPGEVDRLYSLNKAMR